MFYKLLQIVLASLSIFVVSYSQQHTIMTYNLLNYPGSTSTERNPYFVTVLSSTEPDIIVAQEVLSQNAVNEFLSEVLMQISTDYDAGLFVDGTDTDNAIFFKTSLFSFVANNPIHTALRDISEFVLIYSATGDTIRIYSLHLKASQGIDNELKRAAEIDSLRKVTDLLHPGSDFIVVGDFNFYNSQEPAYLKLINQTNSGYFLDPIDSPGDWHNNSAFASINTQSPRTRQFGGGANGGMDDRFDMILTSQSIIDDGGITYINDTYTAYGNDGLHFNDSINAPPNAAVSQEIANAIHYASDHIPVFAKFRFDDSTPVELLSFTASVSKNTVSLDWTTATELNNSGFEIQRSSKKEWKPISFVEGYGTTIESHNYSYADENLIAGQYKYRLKQIDFSGQYEYSDVIEVEINPTQYKLSQNYPNPFNPLTIINYQIPEVSFVTLEVYNAIGEVIEILVNEVKQVGSYEVKFDGEKLSSGIYYYKMQSTNFIETKKMVLIK
jgi:endonuclease/exonuclease/phosphatase family metal-dependent hydrolase